MIQIIEERKKPKLRDQFAKAFANMGQELPNILNQYNQRKSLEGLGIDPNLSPDMQKMMMQYQLMGNLEGNKLQNKLAELQYKNDLRQQLFNQIEGGEGNYPERPNFSSFMPNQGGYEEMQEGDYYDPYLDMNVSNGRERQEPGERDDLLKAKMYAAAGEHDLSNIAKEEAKLKQKKGQYETERVDQSFKMNKPFIDKTYDEYEDTLRKEAILERMGQLEESEDLSDSGIYNLLETLGFKPEWLKNPSNEEYTKLGLDLLGGGSLQADYGSRVLASEFKVAQQRIPTLIQTPEGRRQIRENLKAMLLPRMLKQERMQYYIDKAEREGKPLPRDLRGRVLKDIKPQLEEAYDAFKQRNGRYKVKPGTIPDDNSIEKYYYLSNGNESKAIKMMEEDGYAVY